MNMAMATNSTEPTESSSDRPAPIDPAAEKHRSIGYMKARLFEDAEKITEGDFEKLNDSVPEKLQAPDLRELRVASQWVNSMLERVGSLFDMIRDKDFALSIKTKALIAAGLLYFVLPTDIVPDFIPGIGYIDDALILSTLWNVVKGEVESYSTYRQRKQSALGHV